MSENDSKNKKFNKEADKIKLDQKDQAEIPFWKKKREQKEFLKKQFKRQFLAGGRKRGLPFGRRGI